MRLQQQLSDFNKVNSDLERLASIADVGGPFLLKAKKFWWAHRIAMEYHLSPIEVKKWPAEEIMEALAAIGLAEKAQKNQPK